MYSAYKLNKQGDNIQPWRTPSPIWNQSVVPCPVLTLLLDLHTDFSCRLVFPVLKEFCRVCCDPHSKGFGIVNKAEIGVFFWNSLAFSMNQPMLAIWSLVLPFLNPAWISGSSHMVEAWPGEFWALLCYRKRWVQLCGSLNTLWHCLSLGLEWKLTFSSPVTPAEFSKFAGILRAALLQHHLLGFEILKFYRH